VTDYGFVRVSTGSQDSATQRRDILKAAPGAVIITTDSKAASASKGQQLDALDNLLTMLRKGDRVIVTDSSRLDRRDNLTSQVETMLAIRNTGAVIVSLAPGEETFANGDDLGSWVTTLVKQNANAEKSRVVKAQTWRGVSAIMANRAHHGPLPAFWSTRGVRYAKQAYCTDATAVLDVYTRIADGESLLSVGRSYGLYSQSVKNLIRFEGNHTGVVTCSYTHEGSTEAWGHEVIPVVESSLWWRANKILEGNKTDARANKGGRPVASPSNWLSGVLDCPECGGKLFVNAGKTPAGNPRTPKLRCGGHAKERLSCKRFKGVDAQPVIGRLESVFSTHRTPILAFQRVTGNAHELESLKASLARSQAQLATTPVSELPGMVAAITELNARIEGFVVVPDTFDYAPTGRTVGQMWTGGDDAVKRSMVRAVKASWGVVLEDGELVVGTDFKDMVNGDVVDLGNGFCFRAPRQALLQHWFSV
jgi:DNA invertase Pin-like site-specific DNA recombinase